MEDFRHMAPPWIKYPEIPLGSIGWRMGYGEAYWDCYSRWKDRIGPEKAEEHENLFPVPECWSLEEGKLLRQDNFWIDSWGNNGCSPARYANAGDEILLFWGHTGNGQRADKSCFSQWHGSDFRIGVETYHCMEQYMMAQKARLFGDEESCRAIMESDEPGKIKAFGRKVRKFDEKTWDRFKYAIVLTGNYYKFAQNPAMRKFLMETGDNYLAEASPYDTVWGIGLSADNPNSRNPRNWKGQNLLGLALMQVREELQRVWGNEALIDWETLSHTE